MDGPGLGEDRLLWERQVNSKFAERPILKSLHVKFPSGGPAPEAQPRQPSQMELKHLMHDRRAYEDPSHATPLPSWNPVTPTGLTPVS